MEHPPTLETYGLSETAYRDYEQSRSKLYALKSSYEVSGWIIFLGAAVVVLCASLIFGADLGSATLLALFIGFISLGFGEGISNITSGGKYIEAEKHLKESEAAFLDKIRPFERATKEYYEEELKEFYETNLFRKRSGTETFDHALAEFASMLDELRKANKIFRTTSFQLKKYDDYLLERRIGHSVRQSSKQSGFKELERITSTKKEAIKKVVPAPERLYAHARKIDWDEVNKARRITGLKGEEIVVFLEKDYLTSINRNDLANKVAHVSKEQGDGLGYDVLSFTAQGEEKYIEVKSTTGSVEAAFYLSSNELRFLKEHASESYIYRVANVTEDTQPILKVYSAEEVINANSIVPTQFLVKV